MIKRIITCFLVVAMLAGLSLPVMAEGTEELTGRYDSFVAFESLIEGDKSKAGPWSAKMLRGDGTLTKFIDFYGIADPGEMQSMNLKPETPYNFANKGNESIKIYGSAGWDSTANALKTTKDDIMNFKSYPVMSKYWMRPSNKPKTDSTNVSGNTSIAKVFTAPQSGTVTITAYDANNEAKIWGRRAGNKTTSGATIYIVKTKDGAAAPTVSEFTNNIYSHKFTYDENKNNVSWYAQSVDFNPIENIEISEGDKLWFIVNAGDTEGGQYTGNHKFVHWNPVVTYTETNTYKSFYDLEKTIDYGGKGVTGVWSYKGIETEGAFIDIGNKVHAGTTSGSGNLTFKLNKDGTVSNFAERPTTATNHLATEYNQYAAKASMSKYWMRPTTSDMPAESSVAKVFTAPKAGSITISAEDINGAAKIWGRRAGKAELKNGAKIYIVKKATDGEPAYSDFNGHSIFSYKFDYSANTTDVNYAYSIDFAPINITVNKGEKLYFIVNAANTADAQAKYVHWNPVVTYSDTAVTRFEAQDAWPENITNNSVLYGDTGYGITMNNNTPWDFMYRGKEDDDYLQLRSEKGHYTRFYIQPTGGDYNDVGANAGGNNSYTRVLTAKGENPDNSTDMCIGKWWMNSGNVQENRVAKQFTAPISGLVKISAVNEEGESKVYKKSLNQGTEDETSVLRVIKRTDSGDDILWVNDAKFPIEKEKAYQRTMAIDFNDIYVYLAAGDKLLFEVSSELGTVGSTKYVYWNPVVEYVNESASSFVVSDIAFKNGNTNATTVEALLSGADARNISATMNVKTTSGEKSAVICVALYSENGTLKAVNCSGATSFGTIAIPVTLDLDGVTPASAKGYIKVFVLDSMSTLKPLSIIGDGAIYSNIEEGYSKEDFKS